jgi:hypothetical protein
LVDGLLWRSACGEAAKLGPLTSVLPAAFTFTNSLSALYTTTYHAKMDLVQTVRKEGSR